MEAGKMAPARNEEAASKARTEFITDHELGLHHQETRSGPPPDP